MTNDHLATYLNDHLAGSIGALEILDRLIKKHQEQAIASFFKEARSEIEADQNELREMMQALGIGESSVRKAGAWMGEKLTRAKFGMEGEGLGLVQALESLVLGIKGKEGLWQALAAVQSSWLELERFDFARLIQRAVEQGARMDGKRLQIASDLFRS